MFAHEEGENDFSNTDLNASDKSVRSKTAASYDYFNTNALHASEIKSEFDSWIIDQVNEVYPNWNNDASSEVAGQLQELGGGTTRYIVKVGIRPNVQ